jgi:2-haloacid dehalogenase
MLSNLSERALRANLRANRVYEHFEFVLSTDQARQYKPSPRAYELAVRAFRIPREGIGFAASAGWDASGATWFGFPTALVNRTGMPSEAAHAAPAIISNGMSGVLQLAGLDSPKPA